MSSFPPDHPNNNYSAPDSYKNSNAIHHADEPPAHLKQELAGEWDSFILKLRVDLRWEPDHALTLLTELYSYIYSTVGADGLSRQTAGEIWQLIQFIQNWSSHPSFRIANPYPELYYNSVYEILLFLGDWYFTGECPFTEPEAILEEIQRLQQLLIE
ncbi:hypothetical protein [Paenibacillus bovis]|uniref:Uncharacterized protein n=1 Tax=Paenibacillus bovis TaxID=1616788 RepID=A0A172ZGA1_9BACL|nr:hypothetical protein [Paenibacillus bovis]ANF96628.1 hypothetical protein AR543_11830 [Paenibacillus bovis]